MSAKTDDLITRFLLGEVSDEERAQVEERFLTDNEFFEEVLSAEDALIDKYLLGELNDEQRKRAETLFRSSLRQRREVGFTEDLIASLRGPDRAGGPAAYVIGASAGAARPEERASGEAAAPEPDGPDHAPPAILAGLKNFTSRFNWAGGFALLLVCLALFSWLFYRYYQTRRREAEQGAVERSRQEAREKLSEGAENKAELSNQSESNQGEREAPERLVIQQQTHKPEKIASILLAPAALERGGSSKTVRLKTGTRRVRLQLELGEGERYDRYSVLISTFDGRPVWSKDSLDAGQVKNGRITLTLPSSLFGYDDYRIELKGLPDAGTPVHVADYVFKVRS